VRQSVRQRLEAGARHTCRVTASILIPGRLGLTLSPGQRVNLDAELVPGVRVRESVREEWFNEDAAPEPVLDVIDDEE
jgi:hypothetical protein